MLKIYATREEEMRLLPILAEFRARVLTNYPIKGVTRKIQGKNSYKVIYIPIGDTTILRDAVTNKREMLGDLDI